MTHPLKPSIAPNTIPHSVFDILAKHAAEGLPMPPNEQMARELGTQGANISRAIMVLCNARMIQIEWDGSAPQAGTNGKTKPRRRARMVDSGEVTAWSLKGNRPVRSGKMRVCLTCRADFFSEGPHHRLCTSCNSWASSDGGHAGATAERAPMAHHAPKVLPVSLPPIAAIPRTPCAREDLAAGRALQREIAERYLEGAEA
jgi:hypothetical protein